jgi:hypothetical protein
MNALPTAVWKNLMQAYCAKGSIILAAGGGEACMASMLLRQPCLALCLSNAHVKHLFDHLVGWMLGCMEDQASVFYNQKYKSFKATGTATGQQLPAPIRTSPQPPKRSRDRSHHKKKAKKRKSGAKRGRSSSVSSSSSD